MLTSLPQFSFLLNWHCNGHNFFFRGDKLVTGVSAHVVYDRADLLVSRVREGRRCVGAELELIVVGSIGLLLEAPLLGRLIAVLIALQL